MSVKPEKNIVKFFKYFRNISWQKNFMKFYITIHISKPTVQQYQQCCHLANGNKTCRSLLLLKNNNVARGSQGLVRQSSRNVALRV